MDNLKQKFDDNCAEMYEILVDEIRRLTKDGSLLANITDNDSVAANIIGDIVTEYMLGDGVRLGRYKVKDIHPRLPQHGLEYALKNTIERMKQNVLL